MLLKLFQILFQKVNFHCFTGPNFDFQGGWFTTAKTLRKSWPYILIEEHFIIFLYRINFALSFANLKHSSCSRVAAVSLHCNWPESLSSESMAAGHCCVLSTGGGSVVFLYPMGTEMQPGKLQWCKPLCICAWSVIPDIFFSCTQ